MQDEYILTLPQLICDVSENHNSFISLFLKVKFDVVFHCDFYADKLKNISNGFKMRQTISWKQDSICSS